MADDTYHAVLGEWAGSPCFPALAGEPIVRAIVLNMSGIDQVSSLI
jgi:hypothetical protein